MSQLIERVLITNGMKAFIPKRSSVGQIKNNKLFIHQVQSKINNQINSTYIIVAKGEIAFSIMQ